MKAKLLIVASLLLLAAGCATPGDVGELETRVNAVEQTANEALTLARQAQTQASQAEETARSAQDAADRALQTAQDADERARRIGEVGDPTK